MTDRDDIATAAEASTVSAAVVSTEQAAATDHGTVVDVSSAPDVERRPLS